MHICRLARVGRNDYPSVPALWLAHGLPDLGAAIRTFVDELDFGHAPVRFDLAHIHRLHSDTAGANDRSHLDIVIVDVGWHVVLLRVAKERA